jgi:recombination protein RecT
MTRVNATSNGQIQRTAPKQGDDLERFIERHSGDFAMVLPSHLTPERMARLALSAVRTTKGLRECTLASFASSIMACATLGLEPNTPLGHAYLIPRKMKGVPTCTLIVGYQGLIELMYRSGVVASVKAEPVFKDDQFQCEKGLNPVLRHVPGDSDDPRSLTHVYTIVRWKGGGEPLWDVMTRRQIDARRAIGGRREYSPWETHYIEMACKSGVRGIAKWVPSSTERPALHQAIAYEERVERGAMAQAIGALGDAPAALLESQGISVTDDGEILDEPDPSSATSDREPGSDG